MSEAAVMEKMVIQSHKGAYEVFFDEDAAAALAADPPANAHYLIDARVAELHGAALGAVLDQPSVLRIEATEEAKSLERFPAYVGHLVANGFRRDHELIAIGGGIIQDISCFLAATMMRGVRWRLYPTTLLAQADSCIGSKSSINCGGAKNILGTFTPPDRVYVSTRFLATLDEADLRSGVGEILKVHAIEGPEAFDALAADYDDLFADPRVMAGYIRRALEIKKPYIEEDEFDRASRNIFNYGHSFGHALESATRFAIPHGIAVTMGMDMANFAAVRLGIGSETHFTRMHPTLSRNFRGFEATPVPVDDFLAAIATDKKNTGRGELTLVLPGADGRLAKSRHPNDPAFRSCCAEYLESGRTA